MTTAITTPADLVERFDERTIRELTVDTGGDASAVNLLTSPKVLTAISSAEGEVRSALARGGRYTEADITNLQGVHRDYFRHIVCQFAMVHLLRRRPRFDAVSLDAYEKFYSQHLKQLQSGDALLGPSESDLNAGRATVDGPTITELTNQNWWRTRSGYFPHPVQPRGRNI